MSAQQLVDIIVEMAKRQGAQSAQANLSSEELVNVSFENDKLKSSQSSQRTEIGLKVIVDGKVGSSTTTDPADIDGLVARALEAAAFGSPAHYEFPAPQPACDVKIFDPEVRSVTRSDMVEIGSEMMGMIKTYNPEIVAGAGVERRLTHVEYANSAGASHAHDHTWYSIGAGGMLVRGTDILGSGQGEGSKSRHIDETEIARRAIQWFRYAEQNAKIASGQYPVIFTPDGVSILLMTLFLGLNGKNAFLGQSPLAHKIGEKIADERFSLIDNPLIDFGPRSRPYDEEGVPSQVTPLIEAGVLKGFYYDLDYAGRAGVRSTGNGPGPRTSNLVIPAGKTSLGEMLHSVSEGLMVHTVLGLGQGNPINGEFSVNVNEGYKIEQGEVVGRVKDVMLSGNVYDILKRITAVGDRPEWSGWFDSYAPYLIADGLSVTAK